MLQCLLRRLQPLTEQSQCCSGDSSRCFIPIYPNLFLAYQSFYKVCLQLWQQYDPRPQVLERQIYGVSFQHLVLSCYSIFRFSSPEKVSSSVNLSTWTGKYGRDALGMSHRFRLSQQFDSSFLNLSLRLISWHCSKSSPKKSMHAKPATGSGIECNAVCVSLVLLGLQLNLTTTNLTHLDLFPYSTARGSMRLTVLEGGWSKSINLENLGLHHNVHVLGPQQVQSRPLRAEGGEEESIMHFDCEKIIAPRGQSPRRSR